MVRRADADAVPRGGRGRPGAHAGRARSACRCSGSTGPSSDFRGFTGTIAGGSIAPGRPRRRPAARAARRPSTASSPSTATSTGPSPGQAVTLTLADEIDVSRGDVIAPAEAPAQVGDQFEATVVWMAEEPLLRGRTYLMRVGTKTVAGHGRADQVQARRRHARPHRRQPAGAERDRRRQRRARASRSPSTRTSRTATPAASSSSTGSRTTPSAPACSTSRCAARTTSPGRRSRSTARRAPRRKGQRPFVVWLTGLPGAGKSSIANARRAAAARARPAHVHARRRQPAPRPLQGSRLHRRRPRREQPPRRRGREDAHRRRADRARRVRLPVPRRPRDDARALRRRTSSSRCSSTSRRRSPPSATRRACTRRRARAGWRTSPASTRTYEPPESPEVHLEMASLGIEEAAGQDRRRARGARAADLAASPHQDAMMRMWQRFVRR